MRDAADSGTLPKLAAQWKAAYVRTKRPVLAYAYSQAVGTQYDLGNHGIGKVPANFDPRAVYTMLEEASRRETKEAYPIVAMYYWVGQNAIAVLGPRPDSPKRTTPYTVRDDSGKIVAQGDAEVFDEDKRLVNRLNELYTEMVRRDPNVPYVTYVGAMRETGAKTKLARLKAAADRGGLEHFKAALLASLLVAYREVGDPHASR